MFTILSLVLLALVTRLLYSAFIKDAPLIPSTFSFPAEGRKRALNTDYSRVLPPSQRYLLARVLATAVPAADNAVPGDRLCLEEDWRTADASRHIFSGFSVREVRALGDFPDYATLSGVPLPSPLMDFDISSEVPRPYRPIRWPYHQTMSFKKLDSDFWLELESTYTERIRQRQQLHRDNGKEVLTHLPGSELACKELMEMVIQFLCARYPGQFQLVREGKDKVFVNGILGTRHDLTREEPLHVLRDNVPEDFGLMLRGDDGKYVFRAGVICTAQGWNLGQKIGQPLAAIHGPVPDYQTKMELSMDRFFSRMATGSPIQRAAWGLEVGQPMHAPVGDPSYTRREIQEPALTEADINIRVDWQTLRRLPLSGAVVINVKVLFVPLAEIRDEPYIPELLLKVLNEGKDNIMRYKGTWHVEHVVRPALQRWAAEQRSQGLVEEGWEARTLDEYPFFPGWERKYRAV